LEELIYSTNPSAADTDGDGVSDGVEINQGTDPNKAGDGDTPPLPEELVEVTFSVGDGSGSHSERWAMIITSRNATLDSKTVEFQSRSFGEIDSKTLKLRRGCGYQVELKHVGTDPEYLQRGNGKPDYDWDAQIENLPATPVQAPGEEGKFFVINKPNGSWIVDNSSGLLGHNDSGEQEPIDASLGRVAILLPMEIDQQGYSASDGIRFCRWLDAFPNEQFDNQAANKDRDRFRIKIAGNIPNLTKAKIKATDLHGAVIDGQFVNKTTDGDYEVEMKAEGGSMVSTPILLVSDGDDDKKYNGKGTDDGNDDQTLLADFDSKIVVTFPELGNAQAEFKASKAKGEIKLNAFFLSLDGSLPADKRTAIELHLRKAREIYRQSGTKVTITNISPFTLPSIWATYLGERKNSNGEVVEQANVISYQERALLINELRSQTDHPIPSGQMLITFIDATIQSGGAGGTGGFTAEDFAPPCVISLTGRFVNFHISAAHESGHMLGVRHPVEGQAIPPRLMTSSSAYVGPRYNWNHLDSKRLIESELATMKAAGGFYVQLP
jgi:hypothetical protein